MDTSYIDIKYTNYIKVFTDSSKTLNERVSASFCIPEFNVEISKRSTNIISIYSEEMVAIKIALEYITEIASTLKLLNSDTFLVILSYSFSVSNHYV